MVLPTGCVRSVWLIAGICWTKSQCPRYSPGVGGLWLQTTGALNLNIDFDICLRLTVFTSGHTPEVFLYSNIVY